MTHLVYPPGQPGGSTTQLQYNNAGAFGGISGWSSDGAALIGNFITPAAGTYLFVGPTTGFYPAVNGLPTNTGAVNHLFRVDGGGVTGANVLTLQNLNSGAYNAFNFADHLGNEIGSCGMGGLGVGASDSTSAYAGYFWETWNHAPVASFTASITGTVMTVTAISVGTLAAGYGITGAGVTTGTVIMSLGTGTGGTGTYNISPSQTVGSVAMATNTTPYAHFIVDHTFAGIVKRAGWDRDGSFFSKSNDGTTRIGHTATTVTFTGSTITLDGQVIAAAAATNGSLAVGPNPGTPDSSNQFRFGYTQNANTSLTLTNTNSSTAASVGILFTANGQNHRILTHGNGFTTAGAFAAGSMVIGSNTILNLVAENAAGVIGFYTGSTTNLRAQITAAGSFVMGSAAIATNATEGFLYIVSCAGTPTGTPVAKTGRVPMVWDSTNKKFYIYDGSWLGGTAPGVFS